VKTMAKFMRPTLEPVQIQPKTPQVLVCVFLSGLFWRVCFCFVQDVFGFSLPHSFRVRYCYNDIVQLFFVKMRLSSVPIVVLFVLICLHLVTGNSRWFNGSDLTLLKGNCQCNWHDGRCRLSENVNFCPGTTFFFHNANLLSKSQNKSRLLNSCESQVQLPLHSKCSGASSCTGGSCEPNN
jgi:hypothetical protein